MKYLLQKSHRIRSCSVTGFRFYVKHKRDSINNHVVLTSVFTLLVVLLLTTGCTSSANDDKPEVAQPVTTNLVNNSITTDTTPAKATVKPKLQQVSFNLSLLSGELYKEYTLPIYLTAKDTLHFSWTISGKGENLRMAITTPDGQYIGITTDGEFFDSLPDETCEPLYRTGSIILKLSEQQWSDGYYIFHPHICDYDSSITVKILYWIE